MTELHQLMSNLEMQNNIYTVSELGIMIRGVMMMPSVPSSILDSRTNKESYLPDDVVLSHSDRSIDHS